jgi:hypothetical protein
MAGYSKPVGDDVPSFFMRPHYIGRILWGECRDHPDVLGKEAAFSAITSVN